VVILKNLRSTTEMLENLFPSISARDDVMDGTGKLNPREVVTPFSVSR
jgi:hypothetical protein